MSVVALVKVGKYQWIEVGFSKGCEFSLLI